jgi:DNA-binding response OmpR family regulator
MAAPRVIIAGICDTDRKLLHYALAQEGFDLIEAESAAAVMQHLQDGRQGVLILDALFWQTGATNVLVAVRRNPGSRGFPILVLGDPHAVDGPDAAVAAAVHWYPRKGFQVETFVEQVRALAKPAPLPAVGEEQSGASRMEPLTEELVCKALSGEGVPSPFEFSILEMVTTTCPKGHEIDHVVEIAEHDPLFALAVLARANNPAVGPKSHFSELGAACKSLGQRQLYKMAETLSPIRCDNASLWDPGFFWAHSVTTARVAKMLSKRMGLGMPEEAMGAGLFSGLGYFVLARHFPQYFGALMKAGWGTDSVTCAWEEGIVGAHPAKSRPGR